MIFRVYLVDHLCIKISSINMKSYQYLINKTFLKIWIVIFQMVSWHLCQVFSYLTGVESPSVVDTILKFSKSQNFTVLQNLRAHTSDQFSKFLPQNHMHNMHMDVFSLPTYTCIWMWKMSNIKGKSSIFLPLNYMFNM